MIIINKYVFKVINKNFSNIIKDIGSLMYITKIFNYIYYMILLKKYNISGKNRVNIVHI